MLHEGGCYIGKPLTVPRHSRHGDPGACFRQLASQHQLGRRWRRPAIPVHSGLGLLRHQLPSSLTPPTTPTPPTPLRLGRRMMVGVHARVLDLLADTQQTGAFQDAEGGAAQHPGPQADHEDQNSGHGRGPGVA